MIELFEKLSVFDHVKYYDEPHTYHIGDRRLTNSPTKLLGKYKPKFDADKQSKITAERTNRTQQEVLDEWALKRVTSTVKGSVFHDYAENYLGNKIFKYPLDYVLSTPEFNGQDLIFDKMEKLKSIFHDFHSKIQGRMLPIKSEYVVGDAELDVGGMIDQLFFNKKTGMLEIWDWKTNKEIKTFNPFKKDKKMLGIFSQYDNCELVHYSMQTAIYKFIIERNTGLKLGTSRIAWFHENNDAVKIYDCIDMENEVKQIFAK